MDSFKAACRLLLSTLPLVAFSLACTASMPSDPQAAEGIEAKAEVESARQDVVGETTPSPGDMVEATTQESAAPAESRKSVEARSADCADGVVKDDGTVETGYGFVPQATDGIYVQKFHSDEFVSRTVETVCVCWLKTQYSRDIDFEVVFYEADGEVPASEPYATVPAIARGLADSVATAGAFHAVDVSGIEIPQGASYIGMRWNPTKSKFLFTCTDTSEETEKVDVFFREDLATSWSSVFQSRDPIFAEHRSILLRAKAAKPPEDAQ